MSERRRGLHYAANQDKLNIVKTLLDSGADINNQGNKGQTPLIRAALVGNAEIVTELLNRGADACIVDSYGKTALTWAEEKGHHQIVKILKNYSKKSK